MMLYKPYLLDSYFANSIIDIGDILAVSYISSEGPVYGKLQDCGDNPPLGLSTHNMRNFDMKRQYLNYSMHEVQLGAKIGVVSSGIIELVLPPEWRLPVRQPLYACRKTSKLTWRKVGMKCAKVVSQQDDDGLCRIKLLFA